MNQNKSIIFVKHMMLIITSKLYTVTYINTLFYLTTTILLTHSVYDIKCN